MSLQFENKITLGNILQIAGLFVIVLTSYYSLKSNQDQLALKIDMQVDQMRDIQTQYLRTDVQEARTKVIETQLDTINTRLTRIESAIK